ncbi:MAG: hypothetical protein AB198_00080 [Parcubacteria bacterium C7867-003]|nr:MAG: hypothetical protein AB198_00080 [Parcubacteria bacterium C7867-003]
MLIKALLTLIFSPIILALQIFGALDKPEVYTAPVEQPQVVKSEIADMATSSPDLTVPTMVATTTSKQQVKPAVKTAPKTSATTTPVAPEPQADFAAINTNARKTLVNIFCTTKNNDLSPISGTGVIIDNNGLILTNAHIGQYFLLKDFREKDYLKCVGRTGSPAYPRYNLELVYISPTWVAENKTILKDQNPKGTGENDFAFLRITGNIDSSSPSEYYSYIEPNMREIINLWEPVLLASYPAGFLGGLSIIQDLNVTSSVTYIQDVFTFGDGSIDVISVGGTVVSQKGSSGGPVVDSKTSLIGIITTSSEGNTTSSRGLNAITVSYINRSIQKELDISFRQFLALDHAKFAQTFESTTRPNLTKLISDELLRQ